MRRREGGQRGRAGWLVVATLSSACTGGGDDVAPHAGTGYRAERLTSMPGEVGQPAFSPEGGRIAFTIQDTGSSDLVVMELASGRTTRITNTPDVTELAPVWTQDGTGLLYVALDASGRALWERSLDGSLRRLTPEGVSVRRAVVAPNADRVAFTTGLDSGTRLWIVDVVGATPAPVLDVADNLVPYGWSPDGKELIATRFAGLEQDLWRIDLESGQARRLTDHPHEEWMPSWSPTGDAIVYYSTYDDKMTDLRLVDLGSGDIRQLTDDVAEDFYPVWSPDGARLAFLSDRRSKSGLWLTDPNSGATTPVLPDVALDGPPVWSPDSRWILFRRVAEPTRLFKVSATGGPPRAISSDSITAASPVVSPDGSRIAFHTVDFGSEGDLGFLDLSDGGITRRTQTTSNVRGHSWSPDGASLAVRLNPGGWWRTSDIWVLGADTDEARQLTHHGWARSPVWCGGHVYYRRPTHPPSGSSDAIWSVPTEGGEPALFLDGDGVETPNDCHPSGGLLFTVTGSGEPSLRLAMAGESGTEVLTVQTLVEGAWGGRAASDGSLAYLADRDGQVDVYVRTPGSTDELRITRSVAVESEPDWTGDEEELVFSAATGDRDLWRVSVVR